MHVVGAEHLAARQSFLSQNMKLFHFGRAPLFWFLCADADRLGEGRGWMKKAKTGFCYPRPARRWTVGNTPFGFVCDVVSVRRASVSEEELCAPDQRVGFVGRRGPRFAPDKQEEEPKRLKKKANWSVCEQRDRWSPVAFHFSFSDRLSWLAVPEPGPLMVDFTRPCHRYVTLVPGASLPPSPRW
ncbi:hypothetical protein J3458_021063 [Metarhizium acridum]|uniref:uncharacterized protein n=1 Tax=Metarhizium acridum TaxID=92637 RepID=UPI001C6D25FC|nr:hypothetical protein J3458_021063 [Metarhizium acridum]